MRRGWRNRRSLTVLAVSVAALLAGCSSGGDGAGAGGLRGGGARAATGGELKPMPVPVGPRLSKRPPAALRQASLPGVGVTQQVRSGGAALAVTLRRVIDPLRHSGAELPAQARAVGVMVQIRSSGPRTYDSSATGDISVVTSSGAVTPVLATRGICRTPLDDFDRYITPGEDRVGCVVFAVADGATLDAVRFSPHDHPRGRLTWAP